MNPLILAVLAGIPFALFEWKLPGPLSSALSSLGAICMPLALLFIGASIRFRGFLNNLWLSLKAAVLKVIILPCLFLPPAVFLAFTTEEIVTAYVMLAVPTALNAYIVTKNMGGDEELSSGIIVATILLSVLTFPVGIWILRFFLIL